MPRMDRLIRKLIGQKTARTNAAAATSKLRDERHEREEVDEYLKALRPPIEADS